MNVLTSLRLRNYRSYNDFAIELSEGVNIVVGPNGSGKTNLLEAVLLVCGASSYRAQLADVIKEGQEWAVIESTIGSITRSLMIENQAGSIKKKYKINDDTKQRLKYHDKLPVVLFEPENMRLLTGSPELRRDFLDDILESIDPQFSSVKKQYLRVLQQRNKLLKNNKPSLKEELFVWNIRLSELAGYVVSARTKLIQILNESASNTYSKVAGKKTKLKLNYAASVQADNYESNLLKKLEKTINLDIERGFTGAGPHREDFNAELDGADAKTHASRGETRTLVLSLKLLEVDLIQQKRGLKPLILLDDVFSELDGYRRKALTNYLSDNQTIITTTDADIIAKEFAQHTNTISLS